MLLPRLDQTDEACEDINNPGAVRVEILGAERRRRWGDKKKLDIVMSVGIEGATVTRQQIYTWRRGLRRKGAPVAVGGSHVPSRGHARGALRTPYGQRH